MNGEPEEYVEILDACAAAFARIAETDGHLGREELDVLVGSRIEFVRFMDECQLSKDPDALAILESIGWPADGSALNLGEGFRLPVYVSGGVAVIDCGKQFPFGEGTITLAKAVSLLLRAGYRKIVLNVYELELIDNRSIGELVSILTGVNLYEGALKLLNMPKKVRDILSITRLYSAFESAEQDLKNFSEKVPKRESM